VIVRRGLRKVREIGERLASRARIVDLSLRYPALDVRGDTFIAPGCQIIAADGSELVLDGAYIAQGTVLRTAPGASLRVTGSYVGFNCVIASAGRIAIDEGCQIAEMVVIRDADHVFGQGVELASSGLAAGTVAIGRNVWIGAKATVLKDVTVGEGAVIAASAVVTRPVEAYTLVGGVPAKILKRIE
jgi:carbonic anhydrase/acetyltransferase-like protein (isoleucine patch superfamily)